MFTIVHSDYSHNTHGMQFIKYLYCLLFTRFNVRNAIYVTLLVSNFIHAKIKNKTFRANVIKSRRLEFQTHSNVKLNDLLNLFILITV